MGKTGKVIIITAAATVVLVGGAIAAKLNNWLGADATPNWPDGPGSGDEIFDTGEPTPNWPDGPGSGDELTGDEPTGPGSGDEIWAGPGSGDELIVRSSCNAIVDKSTCLDYVGSYWKNDNYSKLNCSGAGIWSKKNCPQDYIGGCLMNSGTEQEMISWHYGYGGVPFDPETAKYAAMACNANPAGTWINK